MLEGGCHCGAVRYRMPEEVVHSSLCHCSDCRRCAGAPVVGWAAVKRDQLEVQGEPTEYQSSANATRSFCGRCGTGLFYVNEEVLPGLVDIQIATLDDPEKLPPQLHVQCAERVGWMESAEALPKFERYPG
jgi:hypothetical protein